MHKLARSLTRKGLTPGSIEIEGVSKRFKKHTVRARGYTTVKTTLLGRIFRKRFPEKNFVHALDTISISVAPGSSIGIIGRNGSGKSTLLKLISGIYQPDAGVVSVSGKISALIELGAGFHPDFTGRENVYLGGVMFGLTKRQIEERFDRIVAYAELEDFIDDPVRTYSSGMYMRLGFSLAIHTDPDILLVDEVLSVGDAAFVHRCHDTISDFRRRGKTLVFVTHDLDSVIRWCDEALWLEKGVVRGRGEPRAVVAGYLEAVEAEEEEKLVRDNAQLAAELGDTALTGAIDEKGFEERADEGRWGSREIEITEVQMVNASGEPTWLFHSSDQAAIRVRYTAHHESEDIVFGIGLLRADGLCVFGTNTHLDGVEITHAHPAGSHHEFSFILPQLELLENTYFLDVAVHRADGTPYDYHHRLHKFSVRNASRSHGVFEPKHEWVISSALAQDLRIAPASVTAPTRLAAKG